MPWFKKKSECPLTNDTQWLPSVQLMHMYSVYSVHHDPSDIHTNPRKSSPTGSHRLLQNVLWEAGWPLIKYWSVIIELREGDGKRCSPIEGSTVTKITFLAHSNF